MQGFQPLPKKKEFIGPSSCPIKASSRGRHTRHPRPHREDGGDSGADVVARVDGRRDDRAATIDVVVVVIEYVVGRDGAERGDDDERRRTTADDDRFLRPFRRSPRDMGGVVAFVTARLLSLCCHSRCVAIALRSSRDDGMSDDGRARNGVRAMTEMVRQTMWTK